MVEIAKFGGPQGQAERLQARLRERDSGGLHAKSDRASKRASDRGQSFKERALEVLSSQVRQGFKEGTLGVLSKPSQTGLQTGLQGREFGGAFKPSQTGVLSSQARQGFKEGTLGGLWVPKSVNPKPYPRH